jgi:hypothetical protein
MAAAASRPPVVNGLVLVDVRRRKGVLAMLVDWTDIEPTR